MKFVKWCMDNGYGGSPPSRGAWIEIAASSLPPRWRCGRPHRGGRGLKSAAERTVVQHVFEVAPLAGGVD